MLKKRFWLKGFLFALSVTVALIPFVGVAEIDFEKWCREMESVKTLRADFIQKKFMKILSKPLVSEGRFYYAAPNAVRWEYITPVKSIVLSNAEGTKRYRYAEGQWTEDKKGGVQIMRLVLDEIASWMKGDFERNPAFKATVIKKENVRVILRPVDKNNVSMIEKVEILLGSRAGRVETVKIYEGGRDYTQIDFFNVCVNPSMDASVFRDVP